MRAKVAGLIGVLYKLTHCHDCHKLNMPPLRHPGQLWTVIRHSDMVFVCRQCYKKRQKLAISMAIPLAPIAYMRFKKYSPNVK